MTIAAISTASGVGGIAVVRVSGPQSVEVTSRFVRLPEWKGEGAQLFFSAFRHQGRLLDEVVVSIFRAPHSYTGEDVVEISCHGSLYVQQAILRCYLDEGIRLAEPGEFTRRAFLNGKLDLSQAEAVADLIDSTNEASHALAVSQLRGGYSRKLGELRQQLVELTALLELELDFGDEEVEFADRSQLADLLHTLSDEVTLLCDSFRMGNAIKNGIPVAILGAPNVGKSTLLNALVGEERAIVSDIPGTTRDTIEDSLVIGGYRFRIIDTAGLRSSDDQIESIGIERSFKAAQEAQLVLYLVAADGPHEEVLSELELLRSKVEMQGKRMLVVRTKGDLVASATADPGEIVISARTGRGLDALRTAMLHSVHNEEEGRLQQAQMVSNARHYEALSRVREALAHVQEGFDISLSADLIVVDIREALHHLGVITGQITTDEVLGTIFSRFCIGK